MLAGYTTNNVKLKWDGGRLFDRDEFTSFRTDNTFGLCLDFWRPNNYRCCDISNEIDHGAYCRMSSKPTLSKCVLITIMNRLVAANEIKVKCTILFKIFMLNAFQSKVLAAITVKRT